MKKKNHLPGQALVVTRYRVVVAAVLLALILQFVPITIEAPPHFLQPRFSRSDSEIGPSGGQVSAQPGWRSTLGPGLVRATGGLTITKTANTPVVGQGGLITYTLIISNDTLSNLTDLTVTDTVPFNTQCLNISDNWLSSLPLCQNKGVAAWLGDVLTNAASIELTYTVRVAAPLTYPTIITNTDYGVSATGFSDYGTEAITTVVNSPAWEIQKMVTPDTTVEAGGFLTYTLSVTNVGSLTTSEPYTIIDVIPDHTTVSDNPDGGNNNGASISWTLADPLGPNQASQVQYSVQVDSPLTNSIAIVNQTYSVDGGGAVGPVFGSPVGVNVTSAPALSIVKTAAQKTVKPGGNITYTITYSNTGNASANGVIISDTIPLNTTYLDSTPFDNSTGRVFSWLIGDLSPAAGKQAITLTVQADTLLDNGLPLTNSVIIADAGGSLDTDVEIITVDARPDLTISKSDASGDGVVRAGELLTYTITYANIGGGGLDFVRITDTLPASVTVEGIDPGATTLVSASPPVFTQAVLLPGQSGTITLVTRLATGPWPASGLDFANMVEASVAANEIRADNNAAVLIITGQPNVPFAISLETPATAPVLANSPITATVTDQYGNPVLDGTSVSFVIDPPGSVNPVSVNTNNGLATTNISASSPATAVVTATSGLVSEAQPVEFIVPTLNKLVTPGVVLAGERITYTIIYQNNTFGPISGLRITDTLPAQLASLETLIPGEATVVDITPPTLVFTQASLAPQQSLTITIIGRIASAPWAATPTNFTNQVLASSDTNPRPEVKSATAAGRPNVAATISLQAVPTTTLVGGNAMLIAAISDQYGNRILDGTPATFTASPGSTVTPAGTTTNGVVTGTVTADVVGTTVVTLQVEGVSETVQVTFEGQGINIYLPMIIKQ